MPSLPLSELPLEERSSGGGTPSNVIVYRLPNFMYGLSHIYIDTCLRDVVRKLCVSLNSYQVYKKVFKDQLV